MPSAFSSVFKLGFAENDKVKLVKGFTQTPIDINVFLYIVLAEPILFTALKQWLLAAWNKPSSNASTSRC